MANPASSFRSLNAAIRDTGARWRAGRTPMSDLPADAKRRWLGYSPGPREPTLRERVLRAARNLEVFERSARSARGGAALAPTAPAAVDLRDVDGKRYIGPVKNQGECGACVAFATLSAIEAALRRQIDHPGYDLDLSEAHLFYCHARKQGRRCNNGWWVHDALGCVRDLGVVDDACYPYTPGDQDCAGLCADASGRLTKIRDWTALSTHADMKAWLADRGPLITCLVAYEDLYSYKQGVYRFVEGVSLGGHCVTCVGYDDDERCWICQNSWGEQWGEGGFFRIEYGQVGVDAIMYGVEGVTFSMWHSNKQVTGVWVNDQERNAYVYLDGVGWRKIGGDDAGTFLNILAQLTSAKSGSRPVNVFEDSGQITQVYVF